MTHPNFTSYISEKQKSNTTSHSKAQTTTIAPAPPSTNQSLQTMPLTTVLLSKSKFREHQKKIPKMKNPPRKKIKIKVFAFVPQVTLELGITTETLRLKRRATTQIKVKRESSTQMVKTR